MKYYWQSLVFGKLWYTLRFENATIIKFAISHEHVFNQYENFEVVQLLDTIDRVRRKSLLSLFNCANSTYC